MHKPMDELTPDDVKAMPLDEFEQRFKFRPVDALEKCYWAAMGRRIRGDTRSMIVAGVLPHPDVSNVRMT